MTVSKYVRIADDLRKAIERGDYPPGTTLPSGSDLINRYEVSRGTVRQAIHTLTNEGLVTPLPGIGTVVRDTAAVALNYTPNTPAPTWAQSNPGDETARDELMLAEWEPADYEIARRLAATTGDAVLRRVRHQFRGASVVQIHEQWIPSRVVSAIRAETGADLADRDNLPAVDLFTLMKRAGMPPFETTEVIGARMPDPGERDVMRLPAGVPVLTTMRLTRTEDDAPLETSMFASAADQLTQSFTVSLKDR
jgi:GntR family transcriptional regulator